jgi:hypothetical protein
MMKNHSYYISPISSTTSSHILQQESSALLVLEHLSRIVLFGNILKLQQIGRAIRRDWVLVARGIVHEDIWYFETALLALLLPHFGDGNRYSAHRCVVDGVRPVDQRGPP